LNHFPVGVEIDVVEWLHTLQKIRTKLPDDPTQFRFHYALRHGSMKVGLYSPRGEDIQDPHKQDELYVVVSGSGVFIKHGERRPFQQHDVLFVEAGVDHKFAEFSDDFSAWVIFWGPEGGERT
jgi:mannose-6-phosphate isomerase-like protein (cupin superfamily)